MKKLAASGEVHVVTLSMDTVSAIPAAEAILDRLDAPFTRLYLPAQAFETAAGEVTADDLFDLERLAIPSTLVLDAEGRIEAIIRGPIRE